MNLIELAILGIVLLLTALAWVTWNRMKALTILKNNGIPGPKPHILYGNAKEVLKASTTEIQCRWIRAYGKVFGYYMGSQAVIVVGDPELAKFIQIKNFENFTNKTPREHQFESSPYLGQTILATRDEVWKITRRAMTKVFSPANLKTITMIMDEQVDKFMNEIESLYINDKEFDFHEFSQRLTLSVLIRSSFGTESLTLIDSLKQLENFEKSKIHKLIHVLHVYFPSIYPIRMLFENALNFLGHTPIKALRQVTMAILNERTVMDTGCHNDLIEAMINSDMTDEQVIANCLLFFVGGFETLSNALTYVVHSLINHPEVKKRVRMELFEVVGESGKVDYGTVEKLKYLDMVIKETLRMYPPLVKASTRMCKMDFNYDNMTIPAGAMIQMANYHMHYDTDVWSEPDQFKPERFEHLTEDQNACWQPFGAGPRNCMGRRFAQLQIKMTIVRIMMKYELMAGPNTEMGRMSTKCRTFALCPLNKLWIKVGKVNDDIVEGEDKVKLQ